jgi:hypothetical protein
MRGFAERMRVASLAVSLSVTLLLALMYPAEALAYSCGGATSGHCAGLAQWYGYTNGMASTITVTAISSGGDRIQNAAWLEDAHTTTCQQNGYGACWIEAGYVVGGTTQGYYSSPVYFWADLRPGSIYFDHLLQTVPQGDYGQTLDVLIELQSTPGTWYVGMSSPGFNSDYSPSPQFSMNNSMVPDWIHVGQELAGTQNNAGSPATDWTYNQWMDNLGSYHFQTTDGWGGTPRSDNPPYASWAIPPSQSSTGGDLVAYCC